MEASVRSRSAFRVEEGQFDDFEGSSGRPSADSGSSTHSCSSDEGESSDWEEGDEERDWEDEKGSFVRECNLSG